MGISLEAPRDPLPASLSRSSPGRPAQRRQRSLLPWNSLPLPSHSPAWQLCCCYCQSLTRDGVGSECDLVQRQIYTRPFVNNWSPKGDAESQPGVCPLSSCRVHSHAPALWYTAWSGPIRAWCSHKQRLSLYPAITAVHLYLHGQHSQVHPFSSHLLKPHSVQGTVLGSVRKFKMSKTPVSNRRADSTAAAAKWLQSCPTACDPIDGSPPGSPVPGILQARALEWAAISFSITA